MKNYDNSLFGGRLFAGALWRGRRKTVEQPPSGGGWDGPWRYSVPQDLVSLQRQRLIEDEELIAAVLIAAMPGLMRRH